MVEILRAQNKEKKCTAAPQQQEKVRREGCGVVCKQMCDD